MLQLNKLESITKKRKRVGRGGSRGGQSGKGHKGQRARSGGRSELKPFFEGGQMPLSRRLPRRGFTNAFKKQFVVINLHDLEIKFTAGDTVDNTSLRAKGLLKGKKESLVKILGNGSLTKKLTVIADGFSQGAKTAIEKAEGTAQLSEENNSGSVAS